jgi:hypothetical protein
MGKRRKEDSSVILLFLKERVVLFEKCVGLESSSDFWWWCPGVGARLSWSWWLFGDVLVPPTEDGGHAE